MKKDVLDIRRDKLRELMRARGGPGALAKKLGYSSGSYLSQVAGPTPTREISENTARNMERLLGLPAGWFDREEDDKPSVDVNAPLVAEVVRIVMDIVEHCEKRPRGEKIAEVVAMAYEHAAQTGKIDREFVQRLLKLAG